MKRLALLFTLLLLAGISCQTTNQTGPTAVATVQPASGSSVTGTVTFVETGPDTVRVNVRLDNVPPGVHGFHVHEKGDCSAPDATSAGGHFNPDNTPHGAPTDAVHHAGDLGNVTASAKGEVRSEFISHTLTVTAGPHSVVGHAVVLHADADDLKSQPSGNAGARIACGVIIGPPPM